MNKSEEIITCDRIKSEEIITCDRKVFFFLLFKTKTNKTIEFNSFLHPLY